MNNSKLNLLLSSFKPQEIQRFKAFLQSTYFNNNTDVILFYSCLCPYLHSRNKKELTANAIWKGIYKNKAFSSIKFNKLAFELNSLAIEFLQIHTFKQDTILQELLLMKAINKKKLDAFFSIYYDKAASKLKHEAISEQNMLSKVLLQQALNEHQEQLQRRKEERNIPALLNSLDEYYLAMKLKYWCAALHYKKVSGLQTQIWLSDQIMEHLSDDLFLKNSLITLYKTILNMLLHSEEVAYFDKVKELLMSNILLPKTNHLEGFMYIINHCIRRINGGDTTFYSELFTSYQYTLTHQIITDLKHISPWDFKNIVTAALYVKEINWAEKFIEQYSPLLPGAESKNAYTYNMGKVYFIKKQYDKCLALLSQTEYTDPFYQLGSKLTQAKALYELNEFETLLDLLLSFKKILNRKKKISEQHIITYLNFIDCLNKLIQIGNKKEANKLLASIKIKESITDKQWLLEKISKWL
jgi:hypothetical protein